jgi:hypothetical protein
MKTRRVCADRHDRGSPRAFASSACARRARRVAAKPVWLRADVRFRRTDRPVQLRAPRLHRLASAFRGGPPASESATLWRRIEIAQVDSAAVAAVGGRLLGDGDQRVLHQVFGVRAVVHGQPGLAHQTLAQRGQFGFFPWRGARQRSWRQSPPSPAHYATHSVTFGGSRTTDAEAADGRGKSDAASQSPRDEVHDAMDAAHLPAGRGVDVVAAR